MSNRQNRRREQRKIAMLKARREDQERQVVVKPRPPWMKFISRWRRPLVLGAGVLAIIIVVVMIVSGGNEPNQAVEGQWTRGDPYPIATITMEDGGVIIMELYPDKAPNTVNNFIALIQSGFYDGVIFHRVIPDFMVQTGGEGSSLPRTANIHGEFRSNGFAANTIAHERGVVSMARAIDPNSASSQFFICLTRERTAHLDSDYAAFGRVLEGMEVADAISLVPRNFSNDRPNDPPRILTVTVETFGIAYPEPIRG
jgi:peptidyl-prolyl cis-trans isomerase B (cyclophilin B)